MKIFRFLSSKLKYRKNKSRTNNYFWDPKKENEGVKIIMDILFFFLLQNAIGGNNRFFSKTLPKIIFGRCYRARIITEVPGTFVIDVSSGFIDFDSAPRLGVLPPMNAAFLGLAFECKRQNALLSFLGQAFGRRCCCYCKREKTKKIQFRIFYRKGPSGRDKYLVSTAAKAINFNAFWTAWIHTCSTLFEIRTKNVSLTCGSGSRDWPFCRRFDPFVNDYITGRCRRRTVGNSFCKNRKKMIIATATTIAVSALPDAFCKIRQWL